MPEPSIEQAILLLVIGLAILVLELFLPSAGLLFVVALICVVGSVVVAFMTSATSGGAMIVVVVILAMILPGIGLKLWKMTPIGRRMFLDEPPSDEDAGATPSGFSDYHGLMGEIGRTLTPLRPSGTTDFSGRRVDTVSEGVMIERGELVRVVAVEGRRIVVRRYEE